MKINKTLKIFLSAFFFMSFFTGFAQEALKSTEEEYYDFLSLQGITERPTLNYRTLSDSEWNIDENVEHPWKKNNLGTKRTLWQKESSSENFFLKGVDQGLFLKIYGPEWYNSYNTAAPYGQNDGALWQGKGYNTSLTGGVRLETYGLELTIKPQLSFSQNLSFDYMTPNYKAVDSNGNPTIYIDGASMYGYYGVTSIDAPQRFGNSSLWTFDWGDTELRYSWHTLTVGFGTQSIWLGPAQLNPIIHSNNAASYPKIDIGLRKTPVYMPWLKWYLGDIELRGWWGKLTESDYFDKITNNNNNLIAGLSVAWGLPGIFKGLTIGLDRTMLSKWDDIDKYSLFQIFIPNMDGGSDASDQRFSLTFDYQLPSVGFDIYLEWARNDFSPNFDYILRYPFHTQGWTFGAKKSISLNEDFRLKILLELSYLECSADYDRLIGWYSTFYSHHIVTQGYTNGGQWLGAGIGTGGNSQYLGIQFFYPKGNITLFGQRVNPDLDYSMYIDSRNNSVDFDNGKWTAESNIRVLLSIGLHGVYFFTPQINFTVGYVFTDERNPLNKSINGSDSKHRYNNSISLGIKYIF